jgi:hypothetical protein
VAASERRGANRRKDQEMAADLVKRGIYHGTRHAPWNEGINYPRLTDVGSAAYRRRGRKTPGK